MALHHGYIFFFLVLCTNIFVVLGSCKNENSKYLIRSTASRLVLEARDDRITIQHFDGFTPQLWKFKVGNRPGLFYIINIASGKVIDVDKNSKRTLILSEINGSASQQWYLNANGRILNGKYRKNLDIEGGRFEPDNPVSLHEDNATVSQEFTITEKRECCPASCTNLSTFTLLLRPDKK